MFKKGNAEVSFCRGKWGQVHRGEFLTGEFIGDVTSYGSSINTSKITDSILLGSQHQMANLDTDKVMDV